MSESETASRQKVALITGGSQGIGFGVARLLRAEGWRVHVTLRQEGKQAELEEALGAGSVRFGDLTSPEDAGRIVREVVDAEGRLDAVVHSVGPYLTAPLTETTPAMFESMFQGNLMTAVHVADAAREHIRASAGAYVFFGCSGLERWRARTGWRSLRSASKREASTSRDSSLATASTELPRRRELFLACTRGTSSVTGSSPRMTSTPDAVRWRVG